MRIIFDLEADGLIATATKIHCLCWYNIDTKESGSIVGHDNITDFFFSHPDLTVIGHKIITYDIPILEKILGIDLSHLKKIDTLGLSWYLFPNRLKVGLNEWGIEFGIEKPEVTNWKDDTTEVYVHRCSEDVKINTKLWNIIIEYLELIYGKGNTDRIIGYLSYKLECAREQEEVKWLLDEAKCIENLTLLEKDKNEKAEILSKIMPTVNDYVIKSKPKVMYKKDGSISALGQKWLDFLKTQGLPEYHNGAVKVVSGVHPGNPSSPEQKKEWLLSLGWKPQTFKYVRDKDNPYGKPPRAIPQITLLDGTDLCPSVKDLYEVEPQLVHLEGYSVISHRIGLLKGFLRDQDENHLLKAEINGFTNTLRFQHKTIVNLPTVVKAYGELVRGVLIAPDDNHILCGSDVSGLEESTKHHFMYFYDPAYVLEMRQEGFDPHLDLSKEAGLVTKEDIEFYKSYDKDTATDEEKVRYSKIKDIRINKGKKANFGALYGAGAAKIAVTAKITVPEARVLHTAFWRRNWAVKKAAQDCIVKTVNNQMWLFNPVSQFWYSLRYDKDRFSTLNQGTGVYCFDTWVRKVRSKGWKLCGQFHDELIAPILKEKREEIKADLYKSMDETNQELSLNIKLNNSVDFGRSYADIH